jgi:hypothetical protein
VRKGSVVIAFAVLWAGYTLVYTGYVWVRGYDISFKQIVSPVNFYSGSWPPSAAANTQIWPKGDSGASGTAS